MRKKITYLLFIFVINVIAGYIVFRYSGMMAVYITFISLKSKDIVMALVQLCKLVYTFVKIWIFRLDIPHITVEHKNIATIIPVYSEANEQVEQTLKSILSNKLDKNSNLVCIITDGLENTIDDNLTLVVNRSEHNYISWNQNNNFLDIVYGFVNSTPCVIIHKKFNIGKKDSLILAHDIFNFVRNNLNKTNIQFRQDIRKQIYDIYGILEFDFMFCTDADTFIEERSIYSLMETVIRHNAIAACGLVVVDFANQPWNFWNMFQNFQYLYGQYIRRGTENIYGKVSCLPGCITLFKIDKIASEALELYSKMPSHNRMLENIVQSLGTDRRLTSSFLYQSKNVITKFDPKARCHTIPPCQLRPYMSQRRRWGSNAYFNTMCNLVAPNVHPFMRFFSAMDYIRMSLEYFRVFNTVLFIYKLCNGVNLINLIPFLVVVAFPTTFFLVWAMFIPLTRRMYHKVVLGYILNKICSIIISLMVLSNVLWNIGSVKWGGNQKDNDTNEVATKDTLKCVEILVNNPLYIDNVINCSITSNPLYIESNLENV